MILAIENGEPWDMVFMDSPPHERAQTSFFDLIASPDVAAPADDPCGLCGLPLEDSYERHPVDIEKTGWDKVVWVCARPTCSHWGHPT